MREGVAKGAPADRIQMVAERLADNLLAARSFVISAATPAARGALTSVTCRWCARGEARLAGIALDAAWPDGGAGPPAPTTARAVEVLTDLTLRGYPTAALRGGAEVFSRDGAALGRLPASLEVIRREQGLSQAETLDAMARGLRGGGSLEQAATRAADDGQRPARDPKPAVPARATPRQGRFRSAGQLKKQNGARSARPPENPGRGRGPNK
jgi:hypothetical protein